VITADVAKESTFLGVDEELKQHLGLRVRSIDRKHSDCFTFCRVQNIKGPKAVVRVSMIVFIALRENTREWNA